jgi:hypothetical protein
VKTQAMIAVCISVTTGVRMLAFAPLATVTRGTGGAGRSGRIYAWLDASIWPAGNAQ